MSEREEDTLSERGEDSGFFIFTHLDHEREAEHGGRVEDTRDVEVRHEDEE